MNALAKLAAAAIGAVTLTGCLPLTPTPEAARHPGTMVVYHGLGTTAAEFTATEPYASLIDGLEAQGWDVIVPAYPSEAVGDAMAANILAADPAALRDAWVNQYDHLALHGPVYLLGISWGGLVATNIATHANHTPDGLVLHLPALDPNYLTEFATVDMSALTDLAGFHGTAYVSWATDDTRVGYSTAAAMAGVWGATTREYVTLGHTTNDAVVADLLAYTKGLA